jgi:hypothetical protein
VSFIADTPEFEAGLDNVLTLLGLSQNESVAQEITRLYHEADSLAIFSVKSIVALYWWASHMASATAYALGYSQQMLAENKTTNADQLNTWKTFLSIKHPNELRKVYIHTTDRINVTKHIIQKINNAELAKLAKEVAALETWKTKTVTPDLRKLLAFLSAWESTYKAAVVRWVAWFKTPSQFAKWAAMPLVVQLPTTLGNPAAKAKATAIELALVKTWANDSDAIWTAVQQWLVTDN